MSMKESGGTNSSLTASIDSLQGRSAQLFKSLTLSCAASIAWLPVDVRKHRLEVVLPAAILDQFSHYLVALALQEEFVGTLCKVDVASFFCVLQIDEDLRNIVLHLVWEVAEWSDS